MQPSLIVVGLSYPGSPVEVRERFWIEPDRRAEALVQLATGEGIEELAVLMNAERTEFFIWASDLSQAASSVLSYLTDKHGLRLCDWKNFYRLVDEKAVSHALNVTSGIESPLGCDAGVLDEFAAASSFARHAGVAGPHLETIFDGIVRAANNIRRETGVGFSTGVPLRAAFDLARRKLTDFNNSKVLVLSAGVLPDISAAHSRAEVKVLQRVPGRTPAFAAAGNSAICFDQCWQEMAESDAVIHVSSGPCFILTAEQAHAIAEKRRGVPLHLFDLAVPRAVDPAVGAESGVVIYSIDDIQRESRAAVANTSSSDVRARHLIEREAKLILSRSRSATLPSACRVEYARINELCREVAHSYSAEVAASEEQARAIEGVSSRIASRISSYLSAEQGDGRKPTIMSTVRRLFHDGRRQTVTGSEN